MFEILLFGIIQGIFEWLPISSQGNLALLMVGFSGMVANDAIRLSIFLHTGTLLSVLVYFRKDVASLLKKLKGYRPDYTERNCLLTFLLVSTLVTGVVGFMLFSYVTATEIAGTAFLGLVGIALMATGILQKFSKGREDRMQLNIKDSLLLGLLQGLSVIPGISRSGITVSGFLLRGYKSDDALRLSFLMSIPAVLAAEIGLGLLGSLPDITIAEVLIGIVTSFFVGILSIHLLIEVAKKTRFWAFCIVMGLLAVVPALIW